MARFASQLGEKFYRHMHSGEIGKRSRKRLMLRAVHDQLNSPETPEVRVHYNRLIAMGYSDSQAQELIATVLASYMWHMLRGENYTYADYVAELARLPSVKWMSEEDEET